MTPDDKDWLEELAEVQEHTFRSETPIVGPLIARFRQGWNSVSTKWYVRSLIQQQNQFNRLVAQRLRQQDERLVAQDREQTELVHDLSEVTAQLAQANRLLTSIEQRLERLETKWQSQPSEDANGGSKPDSQ